jgi:hypothetical protein
MTSSGVLKTPQRQDCTMLFCPRRLWAVFLTLLIGTASDSVQPGHLASLLQCRMSPNPHTLHLRIADIAQNISQTSGVHHFNPTIIALPYWAANQYLLVSRVVTEGLHQESVLCEANICVKKGESKRRAGEKECTVDSGLENTGGLYCATASVVVNIPPTPAEQCDGPWSAFPDIPGFHDPRIFWSGKGEPLIIVNSASQYACLGLWITDLRTLYEPLKKLIGSQPGQHSSGPSISYGQLTELTRNPASTRAAIEKNWFLFFPTPSTAYIHYDLSPPPLPITSKPAYLEPLPEHAPPVRREALQEAPSTNSTRRPPFGRTFAKLLGNGSGHTTPNLTSPLEEPCLTNEPDSLGEHGHWHQATNALKLIPCRRGEASGAHCEVGRSVHFAIMHRKFSNVWDLPLRYERYFVLWDARPPFQMRAMSQYPVLVWNETASGWSGRENWALEMEEERLEEDVMGYRSTVRVDRLNIRIMNGSFYPTNSTANSTTAVDEDEDARLPKDRGHGSKRENWAYFTYTPSIAWAWRPQSAFADGEDVLESLNVGYLDDEVIIGIGMGDTEQTFARAKAETLLQCLRVCPGMSGEEVDSEMEFDGQKVMLGFEHEDELMRRDTENQDFLDV